MTEKCVNLKCKSRQEELEGKDGMYGKIQIQTSCWHYDTKFIKDKKHKMD